MEKSLIHCDGGEKLKGKAADINIQREFLASFAW